MHLKMLFVKSRPLCLALKFFCFVFVFKRMNDTATDNQPRTAYIDQIDIYDTGAIASSKIAITI